MTRASRPAAASGRCAREVEHAAERGELAEHAAGSAAVHAYGRRFCHPPAGFTLIELLVTLAILGVLACMTVPVAQIMRQREREQELRQALHEIRYAIDAYKAASKEGRVDVEAGATGYPPKLELLVDGVQDKTDPKGHKLYFLRRIPRDPMNNDPDLTDAATWGKRCYASEADDPQEGDDVYDVYTTSKAVGLNGIPYRSW